MTDDIDERLARLGRVSPDEASRVASSATWQATPRNKFSASWDEQPVCRSCTGTTSRRY